MRHRKPTDVQLKRQRPDVRMKVERVVCAAAEPLSCVSCVGNGCTEADDSDRAFELGRDVAHARADHFDDGAFQPADELQFIDDEKVDALDVLSLFPTA